MQVNLQNSESTAAGEALRAVNSDRGSGGVRRYSDIGTGHVGVKRPSRPESDCYSGGSSLMMMMSSYVMQPLAQLCTNCGLTRDCASTSIEVSVLRPTELLLVRRNLASEVRESDINHPFFHPSFEI
jgi:hypothetical protein